MLFMINVTKDKQLFSLLACVFNLFPKLTIFISFSFYCISHESNKARNKNDCSCALCHCYTLPPMKMNGSSCHKATAGYSYSYTPPQACRIDHSGKDTELGGTLA